VKWRRVSRRPRISHCGFGSDKSLATRASHRERRAPHWSGPVGQTRRKGANRRLRFLRADESRMNIQ
jgi:hypothetical protein